MISKFYILLLNVIFRINSPGALRVPNIPENFESFKGPIFHSARWDASIDLEDKVVAVIGSGASAIQIIPKIAPKVKELHCYQRQPGWIFPKINWKFPTFIKWIFAYFPFIMRLFRWSLFWMMEIFYSTLVIGTLARKIGEKCEFKKKLFQFNIIIIL